MNREELSKRLHNHGLGLLIDKNGKYAIGSPHFANSLLWMDVTKENNEYDGGVYVKSINTRLFTAEQIKAALLLADEFLQTPLAERGPILDIFTPTINEGKR